MRALLLTLTTLLLEAPLAWAAEAAPAEVVVQRYALIIGANDGGAGRPRLRFAVTDAHAVVKVLEELGGLTRRNKLLLEDPSVEELEAGFERLGRMLERRRDGARREVLVYYSGHSDEQGLLLAGHRFKYRALRRAIEKLPAEMRITILDSCASGSLTRHKGGKRRPPFLIDRSAAVRGHAILTSASATEAAQESDRVGGSFFTHSLVSGLRGAADTTNDKRVTLTEAYQYAFHETLARTESTLGGAQHPSYDFQLAGSGDLVLTDLRATDAGLRLEEGMAGRIFVRDANNRLVAELHKPAGRAMVLGLGPGQYEITLERAVMRYAGEVQLKKGQQVVLSERALAPMEVEQVALRGGVAAAPLGEFGALGAELGRELDQEIKEFKELVPRFSSTLAFSVVPGVSTNVVFDPPVVNRLHLGLLGAHADGNQGLIFSGLWYRLKGPMWGMGWSGVYSEYNGGGGGGFSGVVTNNHGHWKGASFGGVLVRHGGGVEGLQAAGVLAVSGADSTGLQVGGIGGYIEGHLRGWQISGISGTNGGFQGWQASGISSYSGGDVRGWQIAGIANVAKGSITGAQTAAVFNYAKRVKGVQIGLINYAEHIDGVPLGLINIVEDGVHALEVTATEYAPFQLGLKMGSHRVYTRWSFANRPWSERAAYFFAFGIGGHWEFKRRLFFELEVSSQQIVSKDLERHNGQFQRIEATLGLRIVGDLSLVIGPALNLYRAEDERDLKAIDELVIGPSQSWDESWGQHRLSGGSFIGLRY